MIMADLDDAELGAIFFTGLIEDEVRSGRMTLLDKSDEDLEEEFRELAAAIVGESPRYIHHVDHQPRLLEEADRYRNAAQYELAITLYALSLIHI